MSKKTVFSLYKKEMLDIFRDKKTILIMILVPLFLYPGMMLGMMLIMNGVTQDSMDKTYTIAIVESNESERIAQLLLNEDDEHEYSFDIKEYETFQSAQDDLATKEADAYVNAKITDDGRVCYEIGYFSASTDSVNAADYVDEILDDYRDLLRNEILTEEFGDYDSVLNPIVVSNTDVATAEESAGSAIGFIIPFMLITSVFMGAIYPAIDVTAGERERGTLETMMALPIKNSEIMFSKFIAVSTVAVFTALLNLLSMFCVGMYMYDSVQMVEDAYGQMNLLQFVPSVLVLLVCIPIFAMFLSAVCLCVCIFAKSFKEANNYSTPVLLVFMFASMSGMLPNVTLTPKTALIPIVNVTLFIKSIFELHFDWQSIFLVFISTILYTVLAVIVMSKFFSSEDVLFGEGLRSVKLLEKRSNMKERQMPGIGDVILMFGFMLLLMIYLSSALVFRLGIWGTGVVQLLILAIPVIYAWYMKADFRKLFSLRAPSVKYIPAGICIWLGIWLLEQIILLLLAEWFPSLLETSESLNFAILDSGFVSAFLVVGICPAIAEEFAFRGFLFGTLKEKRNPWISIVVSAVLFGAYHMNMLQFIGGFMMGIGIAYVVFRSGSIWVGCMMHFINNGLSVIFQYYPNVLKKIPVLGKESLQTADMILIAVTGIVFILFGLMIIKIKEKSKKRDS